MTKVWIRRALFVLIMVAGPLPANAAIAFLASASGGSSDGTAAATSAAANFTGATLLVGHCGSGSGAGTISDSSSNSWTGLSGILNGGVTGQIFYVSSPTVTASQTVTCPGGAGTFPTVIVFAFSGTLASSPFDVQNGQTNSASLSLSTGSVTPTTDGQVLVTGFLTTDISAPPAIDSGFQTPVDKPNAASNYHCAMSYLIETTATIKNPTWTVGVASINIATIASFKAATATAGPNLQPLLGVGSPGQ